MSRYQLYLLSAIMFLLSCNNGPTTPAQKDSATNKPVITADSITNISSEQADTENYADYYVTIADTGNNYYELDKSMYLLAKSSRLTIDSSNRYYNQKRNEIILREDDEDEIYRGEYYPRRFEELPYLSLEYCDQYQQNSTHKNIALMAAICETKKTADSICSIIKPYSPKAYVIKSKLYIGCMH